MEIEKHMHTGRTLGQADVLAEKRRQTARTESRRVVNIDILPTRGLGGTLLLSSTSKTSKAKSQRIAYAVRCLTS